uniref:Uncharacterized protein n=1 Tax=Parascaris equorum TaxID=6256 RepID=A0A914RRU9_PAREQ
LSTVIKFHFAACQKIIQQRLRLLGGIVGSARTPTPTTLLSQHTNGSADHRNINYQEVAYAAKTAAYHHQRSVSALPLQDHSQNLARRVVAPPAYQPSSSPAASHVYHRENSALTAAARSSERSLSAFAMPCAPVLHPGKVQRASQCECSAISPAHSSNSVTSSTAFVLIFTCLFSFSPYLIMEIDCGLLDLTVEGTEKG